MNTNADDEFMATVLCAMSALVVQYVIELLSYAG